MLPIFLLPLVGIIIDLLIVRFLPRAKFKGYDILPFFFLPAVQLVSIYKSAASFLPYGFLFFFILVVVVSLTAAIQNKNISLRSVFRVLWNYLTACSVMWYLGMVVFLFVA